MNNREYKILLKIKCQINLIQTLYNIQLYIMTFRITYIQRIADSTAINLLKLVNGQICSPFSLVCPLNIFYKLYIYISCIQTRSQRFIYVPIYINLCYIFLYQWFVIFSLILTHDNIQPINTRGMNKYRWFLMGHHIDVTLTNPR
jgi:hypothetical protein